MTDPRPHPTPRQPLLHDLVATVHAPTSTLSGTSGQIRAQGVQGVFHADRRVLAEAVLTIDGLEPEPVTSMPEGAHGARFVSLARQLGDASADPTVRLDRVRWMCPDGMIEEITITSTAAEPVIAAACLDLACDLAPMETVKKGGHGVAQPHRWTGDGLLWSVPGTEIRVSGEGARPAEDTDPAAADEVTGAGVPEGNRPPTAEAAAPARLYWPVALPPGGSATLRWRLAIHSTATAVVSATGPVEWEHPKVDADDRRLVRLLRHSLDDLAALRLTEPDRPGDTFLGAGVPWYLTLFGRDSLWAARMMLPLGTGLAAGTLRTLARRQGSRFDEASAQAPGKILHELRYGDLFGVSAGNAPAAYYGTVDATPLWISLLHDAWRWGMPVDQVGALLPALRAAAGWLTDHSDPDGDGFIEYADTGGGLTNQGWKDSTDAMRRHDGSIAGPPIALCEVQGYAHAAARDAAALLDAFGEPGADRLREYAAALATAFRDRFWIDAPDGPYPALALDGDKRPVDSLTSNIGHLLGTGLLDAREEELVAARLAGPDISGGYGLRTMSSRDAGYRPLSYHCGSVWPHDTAIVLAGLAGSGFDQQAATLADGLLAAAEAFDYRLPEVYGGDGRTRYGVPVPYPAACRPQAWSAAAGVLLLTAALGLRPDVPGGRVSVRPLAGAPLGAISVGGVRVAGTPVTVTAGADGEVAVTGLPAGLQLVVEEKPHIPAQPRGEVAGTHPVG